MPSGPALDLVSRCMVESGSDDAAVDQSDPEQVATLCDDAAFQHALEKISKVVESPCTLMGIRMRPGAHHAPRKPGDRGEAKEAERKAAAVLLRRLTIPSFLLNAGKDAILTVPWPADQASSLYDSPLVHGALKDKLLSGDFDHCLGVLNATFV